MIAAAGQEGAVQLRPVMLYDARERGPSRDQRTVHKEKREGTMSLDATASVKTFWEGRRLDPELARESVTHPDRSQRLLEIEIALCYLPHLM